MIGDKIRMWRNAKGISQIDLAEAVGISPLAIEYYEENKWKPGTGTISRLADVLQISILDLVEGCQVINEENGDILLVEKDCGCHIKVFGRFLKQEKHERL